MEETDLREEIDLREIFQIIRKRLFLVIIIPLLAIIASGVASYFLLEPLYKAPTTLMLWKDVEMDQTTMRASDLDFNRKLATTYREIARSRLVAEETINKADLDMSPETLSGMVEVSSVGDTEIISISATYKDPEVAAYLANIVAEVFKDLVPEMINIDNVQIIDRAIPPSSPVAPRPGLNMAVAGFLGLMVAVGLVFLLEYLDDTIKTPEEVNKLLGLNVLSAIPEMGERD